MPFHHQAGPGQPPAGSISPTLPVFPPPPPPPPPLPPAAPEALIPPDQGPYVLVLPQPFGASVVGFAGMDADWKMVNADGLPARTHPTMPFVQALSQEHVTDAHLTCYTIRTTAGLMTDPMPRLVKGLVAGIGRMREEERELIATSGLPPERQIFSHIEAVVGTMLALDFDLPDHVRWTDTHRAQVELLVAQAARQWPLLARPTVFYTTAGGFRLMWVLSEDVPVHGVRGLEDLFAGLVAQSYIAGLIVDTACKDWTRLFRLPCVVRADKSPAEAQTWRQPYYAQSWGRIDFKARETLPVDGALLVHHPSVFKGLSAMALGDFATNAQAQELGGKWKNVVGKPPRDLEDVFNGLPIGERPTDGDIQQLLTGGGTQSAMYKVLINKLRALAHPRDPKRRIEDAVYAYGVLAEKHDIRIQERNQKHLHQGISKLARAICFCFRDRLGDRPGDVTPQFIHALVAQPARSANQLRASEGGGKVRTDAEIDAEVWRVVKWAYRTFRGQAHLAELDAADSAAEQSNLQLKLLGQVGAHQEAIEQALVGWSRTEDAITKEWIKNNWPKLLLLKHKHGRSVLSFSQSGRVHYSTSAAEWSDVLSLGRDCGHGLIPFTYLNKDGETRSSKSEDVVRVHSTVVEMFSFSRLEPRNCVRVVRSQDSCILNFVEALPGMRTDIQAKYDPLVDELFHLIGGDQVEKLLDYFAAFPRIDRPSAALYLEGHSGIGKGMIGLALQNMTISREYAPLDQIFGNYQERLVPTPFLWADERITAKRITQSVMDTFKKVISGEYNTLNPKGEQAIALEGHWRVFITANHGDAIPWDAEVSGHDLDAVVSRLVHIKVDENRVKKFFERIGQRAGTDGWPEYNIPAHIKHLADTRVLREDTRFLVSGTAGAYHEDMQSRTSGSNEALRLLGRLLQEPHKYPNCLVLKGDQVYFNVSHGYTVMNKIAVLEHRQDFPRSERVLSRSMKNVSLDPEAQSHRVDGGKTPKVVRLWRLNMGYIINWLDQNHQDADLRQALGPTIWKRDAPQRIQELYTALDSTPTPPPAPPSSPTTRPGPSRVVPFPSIGRQSFKS